MRTILGLVILAAVCLTVAGVGGLVAAGSVPTWYAQHHKPSWTPPSWVFGPVWTVLYLTMAFAAWLVWRRAGAARTPLALILFFVQLALNGAWTSVFFGLKLPGPAFGVLVALWLAILATAVAFRHVTPLAGALMLPYLAWVTFAGALNFAIWRMNS